MNKPVIFPTLPGNHENVEITLHTSNAGSFIMARGVLQAKLVLVLSFRSLYFMGLFQAVSSPCQSKL